VGRVRRKRELSPFPSAELPFILLMSAFFFPAASMDGTFAVRNLVLPTQHASPCRGFIRTLVFVVPHGCALLSRPNFVSTSSTPDHRASPSKRVSLLPRPIRNAFPKSALLRAKESPANHRFVRAPKHPSPFPVPKIVLARLLSRGSLERPLYPATFPPSNGFPFRMHSFVGPDFFGIFRLNGPLCCVVCPSCFRGRRFL